MDHESQNLLSILLSIDQVGLNAVRRLKQQHQSDGKPPPSLGDISDLTEIMMLNRPNLDSLGLSHNPRRSQSLQQLLLGLTDEQHHWLAQLRNEYPLEADYNLLTSRQAMQARLLKVGHTATYAILKAFLHMHGIDNVPKLGSICYMVFKGHLEARQ